MAVRSDEFLANLEWLEAGLEILAEHGDVFHETSLEERVEAMFGELRGHPDQERYWADDSKLMALLGTRRGAKTSGLLRKFAKIAALTPGAHLVYINATRAEAHRVAWRGANQRDGLYSLNERFQLGATPKLGRLRFEFRNDALIELFGADKPRDFEKALGSAPLVVWLDEAQKMREIQEVIEETLGPAMADFDGSIWMSGTCVRGARDYFYKVTRPGSPLQKSELNPNGWSLQKVSALNNPAFGRTYEERYEKTVGAYCRRFSLKVSDPRVRRTWFMEWTDEDALFVYDVHKVSPELLFWGEAQWTVLEVPPTPEQEPQSLRFPDFAAQIKRLPTYPNGKPKEWFLGLSVDLGYDPDPFALTIGAFSPDDPNFYELGSVKETKLIPDQQAWVLQQAIELVSAHAQVAYVVGDAGGSNAVVKGWERGWLNRHPLPIVPAEKSNKQTHQEFLNNDYRKGLIKLLRQNLDENGEPIADTAPLYEEAAKLMWVVAPNGKRYENVGRGEGGVKRFANDCLDSFLYNHRESRHHRFKPPLETPAVGSEAYFRAEEKRLEEEALADLEETDDAYWQ